MLYRATEPVDIPHLAPALLAARQLRSLSRRELADRSGVPAGRISEFESGKRVPTRAQLDAVWAVLADDASPAIGGAAAGEGAGSVTTTEMGMTEEFIERPGPTLLADPR